MFIISHIDNETEPNIIICMQLHTWHRLKQRITMNGQITKIQIFITQKRLL